jgi:Subtilase family
MVFYELASADRAGKAWEPEAALLLAKLPALMKKSAGTSSVTIGMIDGPVAFDQPDLAVENLRVLPGRMDAACVRPESGACTHGTYVAGVLHAKRDGSVPGICPGCTLLLRPIFPETAHVSENDGLPNATVEELAAALREVIEAGARVVNLSVGLAN